MNPITTQLWQRCKAVFSGSGRNAGGGLPDTEKVKEMIDTKKLPATDTKSREEEGG